VLYEHDARRLESSRVVEARQGYRDIVRVFAPVAELGAATSAEHARDRGRRLTGCRCAFAKLDRPEGLNQPGNGLSAGSMATIRTMANDDLAWRSGECITDSTARTASQYQVA